MNTHNHFTTSCTVVKMRLLMMIKWLYGLQPNIDVHQNKYIITWLGKFRLLSTFTDILTRFSSPRVWVYELRLSFVKHVSTYLHVGLLVIPCMTAALVLWSFAKRYKTARSWVQIPYLYVVHITFCISKLQKKKYFNIWISWTERWLAINHI